MHMFRRPAGTWLGCLPLAAACLLAGFAYAADEEPARVLVVGERQEDELAVGEAHTWTFAAEADTYVKLETEFLTTEVGFEVVAPGATEPEITRIPSAYGGGMGVRWITGDPGEWRIRIFPARSGLSGKYALVISEARPPSEQDRMLTATGEMLYDGLRDIREGRYPEGETRLFQVLNIRAQALGDDPEEVGAVHRSLADHYYARGRYSEALQHLQFLADMEQARSGAVSLMSLNNLGAVAHQLGDYALAIEYLERSVAERSAQLGPSHPRVGISLDNLSLVYIDMGRWAEAEQLLLRAKRIFEESLGADHYYVSWPLTFLARIYSRQGRLEQAEEYYREALRMREARTGPNSELTLESRGGLANLLVDLQRYDEAKKSHEEVLEALIAVHGEQHLYVSDSCLNLGKIALYQGRPADAYRYFEQASDIQDRFGAGHWRAVDYRYWLARAAYENGDIDIAELIARLRDIEQRFLEREYEYGALERARARLARMLALSGNRDAAIEKMQEVIDSLERRRSQTSANEADRASASEAWRPRYDDLVAWLVDAGRVEEAYLYAERARSRVMLDQLAAGQVDIRAGLEPAIRADLEQREKEARMRMGELRARLGVIETDNVMPAERRAESLRSLQSALEEAQENYRVVYRDIRARSTLLGSYVTSDGDVAPPRELARRLGEGMAALSFLVGHERSFVFLVRRGEPLAVREITAQDGESVGAAAIEDLVGEYAALSLPTAERGLVAESVTQRTIALPGPGLREALLPDELWELVREQSSVLVLPDGPLAHLPFEAIVVGEQDGATRYWLDDGPAIVYASSGTVYVNLSRRRGPSLLDRSLDVLSVYDPLFDVQEIVASREGGPVGTDPNPARIDLAMLTRAAYESSGGVLRRLPGTTLEGEALSRAFADDPGTQVIELTGLDATERNTRAAIRRKRFIHFGTHGLTDEGRGSLFAALALTPPASPEEVGVGNDGFLELHEIYDLPLGGTQLAVLSACATNDSAGEGGFTLARGFLAAGAERVISSHWAVNDAATAELIGAFFEALADHDRTGREPNYAVILRDAKRKVRNTGRWSDPYFWAPFVLSGTP